MSLKQAFLLLAIPALCAAACSNSPSSSNNLNLSITAGLSNTAMKATILDAQLLVDGATQQDALVQTAISQVAFRVTGNAGTGNHTLAVLMANQTTPPNSYTVTAPIIQVFDANGKFLRNIQLATQTATLANGQSISYTFSL